MSVYRIQFRNGKKVMLPVHSRQEYMAIRDSKENKSLTLTLSKGEGTCEMLSSAKRKLVQMNYSLSPALPCREGDSIPLKGCKTPGNSVGMDIDLKAPANLPEGRLPEEWLKDELEKVKQRILAKKDELGLLMLELSATKGFHVVFRRHLEMSQEENLRWASNLLGVKYDEGAKDITRVFFTPSSDKLLYLSDEIFEAYPCPPQGREIVNTTDCSKEETQQTEVIKSSLPTGEGRGEASIQGGEVDTSDNSKEKTHQAKVITNSPLGGVRGASLRAFDLCVKQARLDPDSLDVWGEHNWHNNLLAVLSVGLPKLMSREQLMAVVREKLPNYCKTGDCQKTIDYFYENYNADKGFMSVTLRGINAEAQRLAQAESSAASDDDKVMSNLTANWDPPALPEKLPRLLELLVSNYDPRFRPMLLISALPPLAGHAAHFRARYLSNKIVGAQQYIAVIGSSGSGKGNCIDLYNEIVANTLHASDENEWKKVAENAELRDKKANAKDRPPKYHPKLRLFETTSKSSLLELQSNLGSNGMLVGCFSEVDGFFNSTRTAYSDVTVQARKGWDGDMVRQYYLSDSSCNTYVRMSMSLLMLGTVKAMLGRMFSDDNCENGLMQRFIPVLVPKSKRSFRPPMQQFLSDDEKKERDALIVDLYQRDLALGDNVQMLELPKTAEAVGAWFDELEALYNEGKLTEAEADLSHRCGEFMFRAAIPLVALYGKETPEIVNFASWVGRFAHYNMCRIFGKRVQRNITDEQELMADAVTVDRRKTVETVLAKMPEVFTCKELQEQRVKEGQSDDVKALLSRYCKSGKLVRIGRGIYQKVS